MLTHIRISKKYSIKVVFDNIKMVTGGFGMAKHTLKNKEISITIDDMGAELCELIDVNTQVSYLWYGDPTYWGRRSPVLFPIVGGLRNKEYEYQAKKYTMEQHGFARDMEFTVVEKTDTKIVHRIKATEKTKECYPFSFVLDITYEIKDRTILVGWNVKNEEDKTMPFAIGGHPGFMCPLKGVGKKTDYFIEFDTKEKIVSKIISKKSLVAEGEYTLKLDNGILPVTEHLFDEDALVLEEHQAHKVSLLTPDKKPYVTVEFDAPLFGVWSPATIDAPFICIEPWYGRCDRENFTGTLEEREWEQFLAPKEERTYQYSITI